MVEHNLAKVGVAGSNPVFRSRDIKGPGDFLLDLFYIEAPLKIKTTGLAGGLHWPCKGLIPAALTGPEVTPPATPSLAAPKGAL